MRSLLGILVGIVVLTTAAGTAQAQRQIYGSWKYNKAKDYYYREYQYKAKSTDTNYSHQYCIYYKNNPKAKNTWVYVYNPAKKTYWARYPTVNHPKYKTYALKRKEAWSVVPKTTRKTGYSDPGDLPDGYFPDVKTNFCPTIPESVDGALMDAPPPDLP